VDENSDVQLVNHLGIRIGDSEEKALARLDSGAFTEADVVKDAWCRS
jgi:hypothetical protein